MKPSKLVLVVSVVLALCACKDKSGAGTTKSSKGDAELATLLTVLTAYADPIENNHGDCPAMKKAFDPVLASTDSKAAVVRAGMQDPEIAKRLNDVDNPDTEVGKLWKRTYNLSMRCPDISDAVARGVGRMK